MLKLYEVCLYACPDYDPQDSLVRFHCVAENLNEAIKRGQQVWKPLENGQTVGAFAITRVNGCKIQVVKER